MCRDIKRYEDTPAEEIADIELVGDEDDSPPGTYVWFNPTFKYLGTVMSWDLREAKYGNAPIKSTNELVTSAKATFCSNPVCDCVLMCLDYHPARDGTHTTYQSRQTIPSLHKPLIVLLCKMFTPTPPCWCKEIILSSQLSRPFSESPPVIVSSCVLTTILQEMGPTQPISRDKQFRPCTSL